jgi:hypothetical protein
MKTTTHDRIRAAALALTEPQRRRRFEEIAGIAAQSGGILLDSSLTAELVVLGELLGVTVKWQRVELPVYGRPEDRHAPRATTVKRARRNRA